MTLCIISKLHNGRGIPQQQLCVLHKPERAALRSNLPPFVGADGVQIALAPMN